MDFFKENRRRLNAEALIVYNVIIGGVGSYIDTTTKLLDIISGVLIADIENFTVDAFGNVLFYCNKDMGIQSSAFRNDGSSADWGGGNILKSLIDLDSLIGSSSNVAFDNQDNIKYFKNYYEDVPGFNHRDSNINLVSYLGATEIEGSSNFLRARYLKRVYLPLVRTGGDSGGANASFRQTGDLAGGCVIYAHQNYDDDANLVGVYDYAVTFYSGEVRKILNNTLPSAISNLSASNITSNSVQLNFTVPSSANALDFYEAFVIEIDGNPTDEYIPIKELTASGEVVTGLFSGKSYKIKLTSVDIYANGAGFTDTPVFSNEILITTL